MASPSTRPVFGPLFRRCEPSTVTENTIYVRVRLRGTCPADKFKKDSSDILFIALRWHPGWCWCGCYRHD
jgi:hypothetical protein